MARPLIVNRSTKTLTVSLNGEPSGAVELIVRRRGHHGHRPTDTFGPLDRCGLPSARVFDCCGSPCGCDSCKPHHTPCHSGRPNINECATCGCGHNDHEGRSCSCNGHHKHHHHEPTVRYVGQVNGCAAVFTIDNNLTDAPSGYYSASLVVEGAHLKRFVLVVQDSGFKANASPDSATCIGAGQSGGTDPIPTQALIVTNLDGSMSFKAHENI